jgi:two-component system response regulator VanR
MKRILIIEDQLEAKEALLEKYTASSYQIDLAETGMEAFYFIHKNEYDIIVVSNDLADLDGFWIIKYLCERHNCNIILTSSFNHEILKEKTNKMGIGFVGKPILIN